MEKIALIANFAFLLIMIVFAIKLRADLEELKRKLEKSKEDKQKGIKEEEEINEVKFKILALEEKVASAEYDIKEIYEKIGILSEKIQEIRKSEEAKSKDGEEKRKKIEYENSYGGGKDNLIGEEITTKKREREEAHKLINLNPPERDNITSNPQNGNNIESIRKDIRDLVILYSQKGIKEEEIAKKLGITYEEVKLILSFYKK